MAQNARMDTKITQADANQGDLDYVVTQLRAHKGDWGRVARDTGVEWGWITKFSRGIIQEPGFSKIARLTQYFRLLEQQANERAQVMRRPSEHVG